MILSYFGLNITIVDSLWTPSSPDISYADLLPDYEQDSLKLFFFFFFCQKIIRKKYGLTIMFF